MEKLVQLDDQVKKNAFIVSFKNSAAKRFHTSELLVVHGFSHSGHRREIDGDACSREVPRPQNIAYTVCAVRTELAVEICVG